MQVREFKCGHHRQQFKPAPRILWPQTVTLATPPDPYSRSPPVVHGPAAPTHVHSIGHVLWTPARRKSTSSLSPRAPPSSGTQQLNKSRNRSTDRQMHAAQRGVSAATSSASAAGGPSSAAATAAAAAAAAAADAQAALEERITAAEVAREERREAADTAARAAAAEQDAAAKVLAEQRAAAIEEKVRVEAAALAVGRALTPDQPRLRAEQLSATQAKPLIMAQAAVLDAWWPQAERQACRLLLEITVTRRS